VGSQKQKLANEGLFAGRTVVPVSWLKFACQEIRSAELSVDTCLGQFVVGEANYAEYRSDTGHSFVP
jgi:hypothetical protein